MAAKSSSCAAGQVPTEGYAAEFGVDEDGAVAIVPGEAEEAGFAGSEVFQALGESGDGFTAPAGDGFEDIAGSGNASFDARVGGMNRTMHYAADSGDQAGVVAMAMMHVEVPTTFTTSPRLRRRQSVPVGVKRSNGNGNACANSEFLAHSGE